MINMNDKNETSDSQVTLKLYSRRFVIVIFAVTSIAINTFQWGQYTSIAEAVKLFYHESDAMLDTSTVLYNAAYVVFLYPITKFISKYGLKDTFVLGAFLNAFGSCIKCFGTNPNNFYLILIGQTFAATAQVFFYSGSAEIAATWFPLSQAATVSTVILSGTSIGAGATFLVEGVFFNTNSDTATSLRQLSIGLAIVSTFVFLAIVFLFRDKPPTPPSAVQELKETISGQINIRQLLTSLDFILFTTIATLVNNVFFISMLVLNSVILQIFHDGQTVVAIAGILVTIPGIISSPFYGFVLDATKRFKSFAIVSYMLCVLSAFSLFASLWFRKVQLIYIMATGYGFVMTGFNSVAVDIIIELTFPAPESVSVGLLFCLNNASSMILTWICSNLVPLIGPIAVILTLVSLLLIGFPLIFLLRWDLKRQNAERLHTVDESNNNSP